MGGVKVPAEISTAGYRSHHFITPATAASAVTLITHKPTIQASRFQKGVGFVTNGIRAFRLFHGKSNTPSRYRRE